MAIVYCNASNIGKLLEEINTGLGQGDQVTLKIQKDATMYYGYFVYYGFKIVDAFESKKITIINIIKSKTIDNIKEKKHSFLIKLPRTGKDGKKIYVYKLRTMQPYSEYIQDFVIEKNGLNNDGTIKDDFRITKFGRFARKYWLDELPMLLNWLKGDLKFIGIRPLSDTMLNQYPEEYLPFRHKYKPGLIPPYYIDKPKTFNAIIESEQNYLTRYEKKPIVTDITYFIKFLKVVFKGVRSS